jgi:MEMO1 family protein
MAATLPRLRWELDFMPSPMEDRPGLLIRDPFRYSEALLVLPPPVVPLLELFNGEATELELREALVRLTGQLDVEHLVRQLIQNLSESGFLQDEVFAGLRERSHREFAEAEVRGPAHAGSAYPGTLAGAKQTFAEYMKGETALVKPRLAAIAAPHVSPEGGIASYRAAYSALGPEHREKTFIVLGTSHYGPAEKFGLTEKDFVTPFGRTATDRALVRELAQAAPAAVVEEDFTHSTEHSIEFQVAFLQHVVAANVKIVPILCGSFSKSLYEGGLPDDQEPVRRFTGALGEMAARLGEQAIFVLGVDMAHMGRRYQDPFEAVAGQGEMQAVEARDRARIERIAASDRQGFWELVREREDDLKWCGSPPFYTLLAAVPGLSVELRSYEQWNIDEQSIVSFAGMTFHRP